MDKPRPFATPESAQEWYLREGFAIVRMCCVGCGEVCFVAMPPAAVIPRGMICEHCLEEREGGGQKKS